MSSSGRSDHSAGPSGVISALATPFNDSGTVDLAALRRHTRRMADAGVDGVFTCGTTGEGALLSAEEKRAITETVVDEVGGKIPVVGAVIEPDTSNALQELAAYTGSGVRWVAAVTPYYIRVSEGVLIDHFMAIADAAPVPLIVYDIPGNTANPLTDRVYDAILDHPNVIGVKDSSGNFSGFSRRVLASDPSAGIRWIQGEDTLDAAALLLGAHALVSGLSNVFPEPFVRMVAANRDGDSDQVIKMQRVINRLHAIVRSTGQGVAAIRLAMALQGCGSRHLRSRNLALGSQWDGEIKAHVDAARAIFEAK